MNSTAGLLGVLFSTLWVSALLAATDDSLTRSSPPAPTMPALSTNWDQRAAAKYLDDRMDLWFAKAKKLKTDQDTASCASCHTTVPFSMARPALRKAMSQSQPTPQEAKLIDETVRRVNTYPAHDQFYKSKDEQSRGTEAILDALILAGADASQGRPVASDPTRRALAQLWKEQRPDGGWNWLDFALEPYESIDGEYYGAALAAIAVGTVPGYADSASKTSVYIALLRRYLRVKYSDQNLYNRTWMLLASTRLKGLLADDQMNALTAGLETRQNADGGWSLQKLGPWTWSKASPPFGPEGKPDAALLAESDGYATGLVTYALRRAGLAAGHPALKKARAWLEANQREVHIDQNHWNCWRTHSLNFDREHGGDEGESWRRLFMSDAATGFAALALLPLN